MNGSCDEMQELIRRSIEVMKEFAESAAMKRINLEHVLFALVCSPQGATLRLLSSWSNDDMDQSAIDLVEGSVMQLPSKHLIAWAGIATVGAYIDRETGRIRENTIALFVEHYGMNFPHELLTRCLASDGPFGEWEPMELKTSYATILEAIFALQKAKVADAAVAESIRGRRRPQL